MRRSSESRALSLTSSFFLGSLLVCAWGVSCANPSGSPGYDDWFPSDGGNKNGGEGSGSATGGERGSDDGDGSGGEPAQGSGGSGSTPNTGDPDLGPPRPVGPKSGSSCTVRGKTYKNGCGYCGEQDAFCIEVDGELKIGPYSECVGEVTSKDRCLPGSREEGAACGYCGEREQICTNSCGWLLSDCMDEVKPRLSQTHSFQNDHCRAGELSWYADGHCADTAPGKLRLMVCGVDNASELEEWQDACRWRAEDTNPVTACNYDRPVLEIPSLGHTVTALIESRKTKSTGVVPAVANNGCNTGVEIQVYSQFVELKNTQSSAVRVEVWTEERQGLSLSSPLVLAWYGAAQVPTTTSAIRACGKSYVSCEGNPPVSNIDSSVCFMDSRDGEYGSDESLSIPAQSSRVIYLGNQLATGSPFAAHLSVRRIY